MIVPKTPKNKPWVKEKQDGGPKIPTWEEDQKRREYYYDDAHGYEEYDPEADDESEGDERTTRSGETPATPHS